MPDDKPKRFECDWVCWTIIICMIIGFIALMWFWGAPALKESIWNKA
jgi:hypothetical protein